MILFHSYNTPPPIRSLKRLLEACGQTIVLPFPNNLRMGRAPRMCVSRWQCVCVCVCGGLRGISEESGSKVQLEVQQSEASYLSPRYLSMLLLSLSKKAMAPTPVLLPGKSHGWKSLVGCSPWGHEESDTTEGLHFHALEKEMATRSSVLAWRIPGTGSLVGCRLWGRTELDMTEATQQQQQHLKHRLSFYLVQTRLKSKL